MFETSQFLYGSNIYEVNIRQYTHEGTFSAFERHLPRLKDMGVEILWLMPIHPIGELKRKGVLGSYYSIRDFKAVNPEFGTEEDLRSLIQAAHSLGIKILLDWVANHTSRDNNWTISNPEFYVRGDHGQFLAPYDWDDVLQLNHSSRGEQLAMMEAMKYWVDNFNIDGFRADLAHLTPLPFWIEARSYVTTSKQLLWLAESEDKSYHAAFDISFTWEWMHLSEKIAKNAAPVEALVTLVQQQLDAFPKSALRLYFTTNHDENSWNGTEFEKYGVYAQAFAVCSCLLPRSIPLIYSGQELPNRKRLKFFEKDVLESTEPVLHHFYKTLLRFRRTHDHFFKPGIHSEVSAGDGIFQWIIQVGEHKLDVRVNLSDDVRNVDINLDDYQYLFHEHLHTSVIQLREGEFLIAYK